MLMIIGFYFTCISKRSLIMKNTPNIVTQNTKQILWQKALQLDKMLLDKGPT